jgi:hypothetical protein
MRGDMRNGWRMMRFGRRLVFGMLRHLVLIMRRMMGARGVPMFDAAM